MSLLIALAIMAAAAEPAIDFCVAPDQPIPHIYVGDPLIIELTSGQDLEAQVDIEIQGDNMASPTVIALGQIALRASGTHWQPIEGVAEERERYTLRARLKVAADAPAGIDGKVFEKTAQFCRIDRPLADYHVPVCANLGSVSRQQLLALKAIAVRRIRLSANLPDLSERVDEAAAMGFQVTLALETQDPAAAEELARNLAGRIVQWEIDPGDTPEAFAALSKALRQGGARAPITVVVNDAGGLSAVLGAGMGPYVDAVIQRCDSARPFSTQTAATPAGLAKVRGAAERAGYENMVIHALIPGGKTEDAPLGPLLARQVLLAIAANARTEMDAAFIYENGFGPGYVYLSALAHRLSTAAYVGKLKSPKEIQALVYRVGQHWTIATWSDKAAADAASEKTSKVSFATDGATDMALFDARNNPLATPERKPAAADAAAEGGFVTLEVGAEPRFLTGKGGSILAQAAQNAVHEKADAFAGNKNFKEHLPAEIIELVKVFSSSNKTAYNRIDFFNLLKIFPVIERLWHGGGLPRSVAVPAMASMSRLAHSLCVMEQEKGEPFVEPLTNTLDKCGQLQSLYITGSAGTSEARERPDWLSDEVSRLMAEAERLSKEGRNIEAVAVAALAEWRARSLDIAAKAKPLSEPEPVKPEAPAPPEPAPAPVPVPSPDAAPAPAPVPVPSPDAAPAPAPVPVAPDATPAPAPAPAPPDVAPAPAKPPKEKKVIHVVKKGDNPSMIAQRYGVKLEELFKANGWTKTPLLHIGDKVTVIKK